MSIIDNNLLTNETAFNEYMAEKFRLFQDTMELTEIGRFRKNIGSSDFPLHVGNSSEGFVFVVDNTRAVGYNYDRWLVEEEREGNGAALALLKEKGLERVVHYARSIVAFYCDLNKDVDGMVFNLLLKESGQVLYVFKNFKHQHQTPHQEVKDQIVSIVKRLDDIKGGGYRLKAEDYGKKTAKLVVPLDALETKEKHYNLTLYCEMYSNKGDLIIEHLKRKYNFECGETPLVEVVNTIVSIDVLTVVLERHLGDIAMVGDGEWKEILANENLAIIDVLKKVRSLVDLDGTDPLYDVVNESYRLCLSLGLFKYSYRIDGYKKGLSSVNDKT
jgi:hypothetical protein|nr:MAG TPA: hypothetical protein [Caudoviricetes sp.]